MFRSLQALIVLLLLSPVGFAETTGTEPFKEGVDYERVDPPQPVAEPGKIEVIEFFWYGCPHCYHLEPDLNAWLKTKPDDVLFIRQPAIFNETWAAHAKAYFTAEVLGVVNKVHDDFYDAIQNKKRGLETEKDLAKFFAEHGVAHADFQKAYHSFAVDTKMRQAEGVAARYGVTGTPSLVIDGKYRTSGPLAKTYANMVAITNYLIAKERAARKPQ
jgi:thiol:disulfide interchange protein DsbA